MKITKTFFGLTSIMLVIGFMFFGCQNELAESSSLKTEHSVYAMISTFIPKPAETTNFGEDEYNSLLNSIEGNGWEVDEKGITRIVPANELHLIVGKQEIITDNDGIGSGKLAVDEIANARVLLSGQEITKDKYDILADNNNIFVNIKFDVTDMSCEHGIVPIEGNSLQFSKGGTWDGDSMGRACLDDNGTGPEGFIGSDCDLAFVKDGCIIDHLYPEHGCYHHHSNRTCSTSIGHSQTWHTHGNSVVNVINSFIKRIWPW